MSKNASLREQLEEQFSKSKEDEPEVIEAAEEVTDAEEVAEEPTETEGRDRDEKGRFVAKEKEDVTVTDGGDEQPVEAEVVETEKPVEEETALAPPNGWAAEAKGKWHELPPEIQSAVNKREQDITKFTSTRDEHASFGKEMYQTVQPYMAQIQAEGGTPAGAVQSLLNTAYVLRTGTPEQKKELLLQTANQFGVDLSNVSQQEQADVPEYVQRLTNEFNQLRTQITQRDQQAQLRTQNEIQQEISAFSADPANVYYNEVKGQMAALIRSGGAEDLKDAYDKACWANPDIRATLQAQERALGEQKRKTEAKEKAEKAKRKDVSLSGGPGNTAAKSAPEGRSVRDELEAQFAASSGAV